jgi:NADPH:quinone reductase-like Zn-dependent oxidoreductase
MRAVVITNGQLGWEERPDPSPGETELLVAVRAAGVNGADLAQRRGVYPAPPGSPPDIPGLELAGEVLAVGGRVTKFVVGDCVMGLVGGGAQATRAVVDESHALSVPAGLSWPEAGGFVEASFTAFDALFRQAELVLGDRLFVSGAAGGVGTAAVQLAAAAGAQVVGGVRDPSLRAAVAELGAARIVAPEEVGDHGPYDVILELVGAASLAIALPALATKGRAVVIGLSSGARLDLDLQHLMHARAQLRGATLRARSRNEKAAVTADVERRVLPLLTAGRMRVPVWATFAMADAAKAYERFASRGKLGKIVLIV